MVYYKTWSHNFLRIKKYFLTSLKRFKIYMIVSRKKSQVIKKMFFKAGSTFYYRLADLTHLVGSERVITRERDEIRSQVSHKNS